MRKEYFKNHEPKACPVCQMASVKYDLWRSYHGIKFWFCSQQCLDRFIAHPGLYVGNPKTGLAEKKKGRVEIKSHRIVFSKSLNEKEMAKLTEDLHQMMGIKALKFSQGDMLVNYDLMEVSLADVEAQIFLSLGEFDAPLVERVKRGWIHYTEECELENLARPSKESGCH